MTDQVPPRWLSTDDAARYIGGEVSPRALSFKFKHLWKSRPAGLGKYGRKWRATPEFLDKMLGQGR